MSEPKDGEQPYWSPTFKIEQWVTDEDWAACLAETMQTFGCTRLEAFRLILDMVRTACIVHQTHDGDDDDTLPWETVNG